MSELLIRNNKLFSSLFSVKGRNSDEKYRRAINMLGLSKYTNFVSCDENYKKLFSIQKSNRRKCRGDYLHNETENPVLLDVPGSGDCWLSAILAPLLGFVVDRRDSLGKEKFS